MKAKSIAYTIVRNSITKEEEKRSVRTYTTAGAIERLKELFYSDDVEKTLVRTNVEAMREALNRKMNDFTQKAICEKYGIPRKSLSHMVNGRPMQIGCFVRACIALHLDGLKLIEEYYGETRRCSACMSAFIVFNGRTHCYKHAHLDYNLVEEQSLEDEEDES